MADNVTLPGTGAGVATDSVTYSGDASQSVQLVRLVYVTGAEGSKTVVEPRAATATGSNVSGSASSVTLLSLNLARLGFSIYNDSTAVVYVKLGTTASATDFAVRIAAGGYYEGPFGYTGRIDAIWASANGAARIVELT